MTNEELIQLAIDNENAPLQKGDVFSVVAKYKDSMNTDDLFILSVFASWLYYDNEFDCLAVDTVLEIMGEKPLDYIKSKKWRMYENVEDTLHCFRTYNDFFNMCEVLFDSKDKGISLHEFGYNRKSELKPQLKLLAMWLFRSKSLHSLGILNDIPQSGLLIPLTAKVLKNAKLYGLIGRESNTVNNMLDITKKGKELFPDDPTKIYFALNN